MTLEELTKAGFTEDQAKTILSMHKKAIDGNYIPKATFDAERQKVKDANATIAERDKQITELGSFKGTAEELQKKVDELTTANTTAKTEYEAKLTKMAQESALKLAIADKVHNVEDILPKLDVTKITFKDGAVVAGLVEQMDALKKSNPYYFKAEDNGGGLPNGWKPFGKNPNEGDGGGAGSADAEFGKSLAKAVSAGNTFAEKADKTYFG